MTDYVYIVDDDSTIREELSEALSDADRVVRSFADGQSLLAELGGLEPGCILLDLAMPGLDGLAVQRALVACGAPHEVIMLTGAGNVGAAVAAMRAGASDFLEKPFSGRALMAAIEASLARIAANGKARAASDRAAALISRLSPREHDVLVGLVEGAPNKIVAYNLGLSIRTVEVYRAHAMAKLGVKSLTDATRIALAAGLIEPNLPAFS
ncbi:response regulator transcription factor [Sphingomonas morindae]|uniref:Response regulator n=1 Tax=Sphingomonas morindae TaxID=1541170 RepID=A0ABY4X4B9_9SPHN|nr:response regulator [Sphingomonas morindae]USI71705.1 response regulator [Sphingomonas morindae]